MSLSARHAIALALAAMPACDVGNPASVAGNVVIQVTQGTIVTELHVQTCVDARITDGSGAVTWETGDPTTIGATTTLAEADGAVCGELTAPLALRGECAPGSRSSVTIWTETIYRFGIRDWAEDYGNPCADGCTLSFDCPAAGKPATTVAFDLSIQRDAHQGFLDFALNTAEPSGTTSVCIDLRVTNGDGTLIWAAGDPTVTAATEAEAIARGALCSTHYGNAGGGDLAYVGPCDAAKPQTTATAWIAGVYFDAATPEAARQWRNPCPPATQGKDPESWSGGCRVVFQCLENIDTGRSLSVDLVAGTSHL